MSDARLPPDTPSSPLALVCWRGGDGARVTTYPLPRETAEALARAYATMFPRQGYWVEPVSWPEPASPPRRREA